MSVNYGDQQYGTGGERGSGLSGHIKLGIVSITVELNTIVSEGVAKREEVDNKCVFESPQH